MTTYAVSTGQQWPFFSLSGFEAEADLLINQTNTGKYVALHPLVTEDNKLEWETYSNENTGWIQAASQYSGESVVNSSLICPVISQSQTDCIPESSSPDELYAPIWQIAPATEDNQALVNFNGFASEDFTTAFFSMIDANAAFISDATNLDTVDEFPTSLLMTPVRQGVRRNSPIVAILVAVIPWSVYFENLLPEGENGIVIVVTNERQQFSFEVNGPRIEYLGPNDLHDPEYDYFAKTVDFATSIDGVVAHLGFNVSVYPSEVFEEDNTDNSPRGYTLAVAGILLFALTVFGIYDFFVEKRQTMVMISASKSHAIINSLFPANVRDRLLEEQEVKEMDKKLGNNYFGVSTVGANRQAMQSSKPIADLFAEATVMFCDIAGFTAWSSIREPSQVFLLLETVYNAFDKIARKMKVFKVETIGDSYVAVAGVPNPRADHAEAMARFAHKCMVKFNNLVFRLETSLGPGTSELKMRFGLHR